MCTSSDSFSYFENDHLALGCLLRLSSRLDFVVAWAELLTLASTSECFSLLLSVEEASVSKLTHLPLVLRFGVTEADLFRFC